MQSTPPKQTSLGNFNYASLQSLMVFYSVPVALVQPLLVGTGLQPGVFDGQSLVNLNFERYAGFGSTYSSYVDEVEFNVVAFPNSRAGLQPQLSVNAYLNGGDQSKIYGNYRVNVPCDNQPAVIAGSTKYGEVKFWTAFDFAVPDINDPAVTTWWIRCYAPPPAPTPANPPTAPASQVPFIFDLKVNLSASGAPTSAPIAFSPVPAYANLMVQGDKRLITSSRVVFGIFRGWIPNPGSIAPAPLPAGMATLVVGDARHTMTDELSGVFGQNPSPVGILLYESPPAAASAHTRVDEPL